LSRQDIENASPIRIALAESMARTLGFTQIIIFGHSQESGTVVTTWGDTVERSAQAAAGANSIKKQWNWPEDTLAESAKVEKLKQLVEKLARVHVIVQTERGWGSRVEGYMAFDNEAQAKGYCAAQNRLHNTATEAPDWYMVWSYSGSYECSLAFLTKVMQGPVSFDSIQELTA